MVSRVSTVAFEGVEARPVDVQVHVASGNVVFNIVGLGDKAVKELQERVRSALIASGLALPAKRITVNLAPADMPKEGSHYDLPIALGVMAAIGAIPHDALEGYAVIGELALDGTISAVAGVLPAAIAANAAGKGLICPAACGPEAAWASADLDILAPRSLIQLANHFKGTQVLSRPAPALRAAAGPQPDLRDIKGQESAKRALEVAAAGGHNLLMSGSPGAGKSMLAQRLPSILPPLTPRELLEVSMIHSVAGILAGGALTDRRPFRAPHHSASMPALVGGGVHARPGEISLAHNGVLFLDELPEFQAQVLDSLRQPIETGEVAIARANHRVVYPARFQLVAAMNPCRCGSANEPGFACRRAPNERCVAQYLGRLSGPLLDRFDLLVEVPAVSAADLMTPPPREGSAEVAARVAAARRIQLAALRRSRPRRASPATPPPRPIWSRRSPRRTTPAFACCAMRPNACVSRRAAITGCSSSPARSPISTAAARSGARIWRKPCPIAARRTAPRRRPEPPSTQIDPTGSRCPGRFERESQSSPDTVAASKQLAGGTLCWTAGAIFAAHALGIEAGAMTALSVALAAALARARARIGEQCGDSRRRERSACATRSGGSRKPLRRATAPRPRTKPSPAFWRPSATRSARRSAASSAWPTSCF